jgi:hypothetical protein
MGRMNKETVNRLIWGLFLVAIGGLLLAANLGVNLPHRVWNYWPFLLITLGVARMLLVRDHDSPGDGFWMLLAGLYGWISIWQIGGLTWGTAWPIFVIAGGLSVLLKPTFLGCGRSARRTSQESEVDRVG